ncbi:F0F1 ATP synthase subunit gamma [Lichenicola sp.]|uniref:F0F1 ATP synthase subunit gamma n=1 Tax=Lichenicola sp. TaxID=2804529 RepID=UPI003B002059
MTERLAELDARVGGIRELGAVVNAMRGIAAARVQQAGTQLAAVDRYAAIIMAAIGQALLLAPGRRDQPAGEGRSDTRAGRPHLRTAIVLFCAEQGFAGAFSQRVLDFTGDDLARCELFLIGTRGNTALLERGIVASWTGAMPAHSQGIPRLADRIVDALYVRIASGEIDRLDAVFGRWEPGTGATVQRQHLFPVDMTAFPRPADLNPPLLNLAPAILLQDLTANYMHAQLCEAALHGFAAENQARMEAMAAAHNQIGRELSSLQAMQRMVRQEEITAEIIELAAGETASRSGFGQ